MKWTPGLPISELMNVPGAESLQTSVFFFLFHFQGLKNRGIVDFLFLRSTGGVMVPLISVATFSAEYETCISSVEPGYRKNENQFRVEGKSELQFLTSLLDLSWL